jgi:ribosomal protein L11 methyltransferase
VAEQEPWTRFTLDLPTPFADWVAAELVDWGCPGVEIQELLDESPGASGIRLVIFFPRARSISARKKLLAFMDSLGDQGRPYTLGEPEAVPPVDWAQEWRHNFPPKPVGEKLLIIPPWEAPAHENSRIPIYLQPGMAFGTGWHPSTVLVLESLETLAAAGRLTGDVLDIGCGSGVLSIGAARLGAGRVVALDYDVDAVNSARDNVHRNGLDNRIEVVMGRFPGESRSGRYDLVLANVYYTFFESNAAAVADHLGEGGTLLASGLQPPEGDQVVEILSREGLVTEVAITRDGWSLVRAERS